MLICGRPTWRGRRRRAGSWLRRALLCCFMPQTQSDSPSWIWLAGRLAGWLAGWPAGRRAGERASRRVIGDQ